MPTGSHRTDNRRIPIQTLKLDGHFDRCGVYRAAARAVAVEFGVLELESLRGFIVVSGADREERFDDATAGIPEFLDGGRNRSSIDLFRRLYDLFRSVPFVMDRTRINAECLPIGRRLRLRLRSAAPEPAREPLDRLVAFPGQARPFRFVHD